MFDSRWHGGKFNGPLASQRLSTPYSAGDKDLVGLEKHRLGLGFLAFWPGAVGAVYSPFPQAIWSVENSIHSLGKTEETAAIVPALGGGAVVV